MEKLKYTIIKDENQYNQYCNILESLTDLQEKNADLEDEIDLLTLLIEKYDEDHQTFNELNPIELLRSFMDDHQLNAAALSSVLQVSKGYVSDILNYKKGLSKDVIRKLAAHFKVRQDAFNRPYSLKGLMTATHSHAAHQVSTFTKESAK